jgi:transglutaminase-like putative cysteine protease
VAQAFGPRGEHQVGCRLTFAVTEPARFAAQIAPATTAGEIHDERLGITLDGAPVDDVTEHQGAHGARIHRFASQPGELTVDLATVLGAAPPIGDSHPADGPDDTVEALVALRQSRYCESDRLVGFAATEFPGTAGEDPYATAVRVSSWVFERLAYAEGSSDHLDSAVDTLLTGAGVCRDYAHLTIALCRALGIPARLASVYAPGLMPMDFHAVTEVLVSGVWLALDSTRLAPRPELVRIATGRDAADTAFATVLSGRAELVGVEVFASSDRDLAFDDHVAPLSLA